MKGPYERLKYDLRRLFECPRCRRRLRLPGQFTSQTCTCTDDQGRPLFMKLIEDGPPPPKNDVRLEGRLEA
jgi:hypothetical protein